MNAIEIEQAITDLVEQPFDPVEFPAEKGKLVKMEPVKPFFFDTDGQRIR